jgi:hypothetical protein
VLAFPVKVNVDDLPACTGKRMFGNLVIEDKLKKRVWEIKVSKMGITHPALGQYY